MGFLLLKEFGVVGGVGQDRVAARLMGCLLLLKDWTDFS